MAAASHVAWRRARREEREWTQIHERENDGEIIKGAKQGHDMRNFRNLSESWNNTRKQGKDDRYMIVRVVLKCKRTKNRIKTLEEAIKSTPRSPKQLGNAPQTSGRPHSSRPQRSVARSRAYTLQSNRKSARPRWWSHPWPCSDFCSRCRWPRDRPTRRRAWSNPRRTGLLQLR